MKLSTLPYKGTHDWYPDEMRIRNYIFNTWRRVAKRHGYEEYDAPLLEPIELFSAKSGQELVSEQTYSFVDRGGRQVVIRPELTPSVSRMIAGKSQELAMPVRWFNISQFMRYERPQRGREREFWQLNCDIFGADGVMADFEIISMGYQILKEFGASDSMFTIRINNRRIINTMMANYLELDGVQAELMIKLFDRKDKIAPEDFRDQAIEIFGESNAKNGLQKVAELLAAKNMADLPEVIRDSTAVREVQELFTLLERDGIKNAIFDITLMRGFDYYSGTVFELFDNHPDNKRALFGGGRYDGLVGLFGVAPIGAVGFAPGLSMTELFLKSHNLIPKLGSATDICLLPIGDNLKGALSLANDLRSEGVNVEVDFTDRKLDKKLKNCTKKDIRYALFVGEEELTSGIYKIKDLVSGTESSLSFERLISEVLDARKNDRLPDELDVV